MALILADRVRETTTTVGTGSVTLAGALTGFQPFSIAVGNGNTTYYVIAGQGTSEWEVGVGTYESAGNTLARTTVLASSNGGSLVNFSAGIKDTWVDYAAGKAVTTDTLAYPPAIGSTTPAAGTFTTLTATGQTSLGGAAGSESLRVETVSGGTSWLNVKGAINSTVEVTALGPIGTNIPFSLSSRGTGSVSFRTGAQTQTQAVVSHTASAVNYVQVTGAATGGHPTISSQGSDANARLILNAKGSSSGIDLLMNNARQMFIGTNGSAVNYFQTGGTASGIGLALQAQGADTNISQVFQSKGTGAIDLAAGSSGVNISNGGTVTAITRTAAGSGYTSVPTVAISAPTTAGGVQATVTTPISINVASISNGGTGYTLNDVITVVGGTFATTASRFTVSAVSGGVVTGLTASVADNYTVFPTQPANTTGGTGTGLTLTSLSGFVPSGSFVITAAGSGYVEQPTVSFSGGGGSGAAAYATVGAGTVIRSLGSTVTNSLDFYTPAGLITGIPNLRLRDTTGDSYWASSSQTQTALLTASGNTNAIAMILAAGTGNVTLRTGGGSQFEQFRASHTASAVNYVQVTGSATGAGASALGGVLFTGSDTNVNGAITSKGVGYIAFAGGGATSNQAFRVITTNAVSTGNLIAVQGSAAGSSPSIQAISGAGGSDTNIDLTLTPKGTGTVVANGPFTATGQTDLGGPVSTPVFRVNASTPIQFLDVFGGTTGTTTLRSWSTNGSSSGLNLQTRGSLGFNFATNGGSASQLNVAHTVSAVNYVQVTGAATGGPPVISAQGSDANIDLALNPKGTGNVRFGTYTASMALTVQGYIEIKDAGGTIRKLAVIA